MFPMSLKVMLHGRLSSRSGTFRAAFLHPDLGGADAIT